MHYDRNVSRLFGYKTFQCELILNDSFVSEFARMNMQLFSRFIPNIEATAQVENLQNMVEQMREMQAEIRENLELAE